MIRVVITQDEDGIFIANIPSLTYCTTYGDTVEEAMTNIREALEGTLEVMMEEGIPIPNDSDILEYYLNIDLPHLAPM